jgi:DnaK suppressor protein
MYRGFLAHRIQPMQTTMNYELVKQRLLHRKQELTSRGRSVDADLRRENEPLSADFADQATQRENDDVLVALGESGAAELAQINQALERLARGEYGRCQKCGDDIAAARLAVVPHARHCASCAETPV